MESVLLTHRGNMGLIITRKTGESITITDKETDENIVITIEKGSGWQFRVHIEASKQRFKIWRGEKKKEEA